MFFLKTSLLCILTVFFIGCSTPESKGNLDVVLCWLRPSCQPHHPPDQPITPRKTASRKKFPAPPPPQQPPPKKIIPRSGFSTPCVTSAQITVQKSKPYVTVSYEEPTTKANGTPLTNLAKTTIYHDVGKGRVKYKDIPATSPQGGGKVHEKIVFSMKQQTSIQATICVTATDTNGYEG